MNTRDRELARLAARINAEHTAAEKRRLDDKIISAQIDSHVHAFKPVAFIIDRSTALNLSDCFRQMGGAWTAMYELWNGLEFAYLGLLAHTPERIRKRAPLTMMIQNAGDETTLRKVIQNFCSKLDDVTCFWVFALEKDSLADRVVREEVLRDSVARGNA